MRLKKLIVKDLFGHFNHVIPFQNDNITIITAPNGYGKTIVLKIIDAIFNRNFGFLSRLDFTSIELITSEGVLKITKDQNMDKSDEMLISLDSTTSEDYRYQHEKIIRNLKRFPSHMIDTRLPFLTQVGEREWIDDRTGELVLGLGGQF